MPSSVSSPDDLSRITDSIVNHSFGARRPRPGLRAAAVLAVVGGVSAGVMGQDFSGSGTADFNDGAEWDGGLPGGFPDFGGGSIDFSGGDADINVVDLVLGVGGMTNSSDGDIVFDGTGSWTFDVGGATVTPGAGSFTFELDVTALGNVTFELADGSVTFNGAFDAQGGTIRSNGGIVDFNGDTTSSDGTVWEADGGGFTWTGAFTGTGNQSFVGISGTVADDVFTFDGEVTFNALDADPNAAATFDQATVSFSSTLIIDPEDPDAPTGSAYAFVLLNDAILGIAEMQVNTETFTFDLGGDSVADISGGVEFTQANAVLQVLGTGTLGVQGPIELSDSFRLLADSGATINWSGRTTLGGTTLIDPNDPDSGENPNWLIDTSGNAGDATIAITGAIIGGDDTIIRVTTDGTDDDVSFSSGSLTTFTGTIELSDDSALTFAGGGSGGGEVSGIGLSLGAGSEVFLGAIDPDGGGLNTNQFLFQTLEDTTVATAGVSTASITLDSAFDATAVIRNGTYAGSFQDVGTGDLSVWWAQGETRYNGQSTVDGTWEIKNTGVHRLGTFEFDLDGDDVEDTIRASVDGISGFLVTQATAYLENADVSTDPGGGLDLVSGNSSTATLVIENTSTLSADGDFSMNAGSLLQITGESTIATGINLDIGSASSIDGAVEISAESDRTADPADPLAWIANASFGGAATIGETGSLALSNSAFVIFGDTLETAGGITLEDTAYLDVVGTFTQTAGTTVLEAGTTLSAADLVLQDGSVFELNDSNLNDTTYAVIETDAGIVVEEGATLFGSGEISMAAGNLEYSGVVMAGAMGDSEGLLHITDGDLVSQTGGELHFGLTGDVALAVSDGVGQSSIIQVDGNVDFGNSGALVVDVQGASYIPTDLTFTLLEAGAFINEDEVDLQAGSPSVTRTWNWEIDTLGLLDRLYAQSDADYTSTLSGDQLAIGNLLNSFIPDANADPNSNYGVLLGQLDQIQTAAEYQAAITGLEPTAQVSAIQVTALSQYHEVLRREIRQRYVEAERRTPTPFRIGEPMQLMSADDAVATRSIRREASPDTSARGFGTFWTRNIKTPTEGDVVGLDGKENGGFGAFAWDLSDSWVAGVDLGYSAFTGNLDGGYGNTRIGTLRGGGFATWSNDSGLFFDGALSAAWNHYDFTRLVPSTDLYALSNADGWQVDLSLGGGYRMELEEGFAFTPMASFLYSYINTGNIDENSDTVAALSIDPGDLSSFIGRVGAGVSWSALPGLVLDGEAGWQGNFTDNGDYNVGLSGLGANVPIEVKDQTINTAYYGAGVSWNPTRNVVVDLNWQGRAGDGLHSSMFYGGVSISF